MLLISQYLVTHTHARMHARTHAHTFIGPFSRTTRVGWYQKGKTKLDFTEARDSEWQWHQLGHMQVCTSFQTDNHASTSPLSFLQAGCPSCRPANSVKTLKAITVPCHKCIIIIQQIYGSIKTSWWTGGGYSKWKTELVESWKFVAIHVQQQLIWVLRQIWVQCWDQVSVFVTARCCASAVLAMGLCLSVCLCLCLSVTSRSSTKTAKRTITQTTPHDSPGTLVFWCQRSPRNSTGVTPYKGAECRWGGSKSATFDQ